MTTIKDFGRIKKNIKSAIKKGFRWTIYLAKAGNVAEVDFIIGDDGSYGFCYMADFCTLGLLNKIGKFLQAEYPKCGKVKA